MPDVTTGFSLTLNRFVAATPERAFLAWTDPDLLKAWFGPESRTCPTAELDPRPGGSWRACMRADDGAEAWVEGEYREVDPPHRLSFTWAWVNDGERGHETLITIDFRPKDGGTEITMLHEGFETEESAANHNEGWTSSMVCFVRAVEA